MNDYFWGTFDTVHWHWRLWTPDEMQRYDPNRGLVFSWRKVTPAKLFRAAWNRWNWQWFLRFSRGVNGRCYCQSGWELRWFFRCAGFGWHLWAGHYGGPVPCPCDEAMDEVFGVEDEFGVRQPQNTEH